MQSDGARRRGNREEGRTTFSILSPSIAFKIIINESLDGDSL
jgi:hypothetical protein